MHFIMRNRRKKRRLGVTAPGARIHPTAPQVLAGTSGHTKGWTHEFYHI